MTLFPEFPDYHDITIVTSNPEKMREFRKLVPESMQVCPGEDLREVMGDAEQIITYKAMDAGEGRIVEDTILVVDGKPWVDFKWKIPDLLRGGLAEGTPLIWQVRMGVMWKGYVFSFLGQIHGSVCSYTVDGVGMDPIFLVPEAGLSLSQLDQAGTKKDFSARNNALKNLLAQKAHRIVDIRNVEPWQGGYQNE